MNLREAAQQALEALEMWVEGPFDSSTRKGAQTRTSVAINALRTALAEPETEAETYKRLYELRGKALERPCFHCGYKPEKIYPMEQRTEPEQEPVAWRYKFARGVRWDFAESDPAEWRDLDVTAEPLYTHPPQRQPLTDEEIVDLWADVSIDYDDQINIIEMARAIERAHGIGGEA